MLYFSVCLSNWNVFCALLLPLTEEFFSEKHTSPQCQAMLSSGALELPPPARLQVYVPVAAPKASKAGEGDLE